MSTKIKVDGISYYAQVHRASKMSGKFEVSLVVDDATAKQLESTGLVQAKRADGTDVTFEGHEGKVFKFKRAEKIGAPRVVDSQGKDTALLIGNGSKVRLYGTAYAYSTKTGNSGVAGGLNTLQVIDLVSFNDVDKIEGGFVDTGAKEETLDLSDSSATSTTSGKKDGDVEDFFA